MRSLKRIAAILFCVVALIAALLVVDSVSSRPPKQINITSDFDAHRASYERVRTMLSEDKRVSGVSPWGIQLEGSTLWKIPPDGGMPVKRYQEYLALLKEINASRVSQDRDPEEVSFGTWGSGWGGDTRHVEICWMEQVPSNTVASLDAFYRTEKPRSPSYVHINGNWYIWADW